MNKALLIALLCVLISFTFAVQFDSKELGKQVVDVLLSKPSRNDCASQFEMFRKYGNWAPKRYHEIVILWATDQIWGQFPGLPKKRVEDLIRGLFDERIPTYQACQDFEEELYKEYMRRNQCSEGCINDHLNIRIGQLFAFIQECGTDFRCYMDKLADQMFGMGDCLRRCILGQAFDEKAPETEVEKKFVEEVKQRVYEEFTKALLKLKQ